MNRMSATLMVLSLSLANPLAAQQMPTTLNDYPTDVRADYVFGCMAANGQGQDILRKCSCSIDTIASILPYDQYVDAETVLAMQQGSGENLSMFKSAIFARDMVADLRRAQAEAEMVCF